MLKTFVFYAAIVAVLVIATIVSRRRQNMPAGQEIQLPRRITSGDAQ